MEPDLGKLFIGGISWDTDEERLKEYFGKYGDVVQAVIMRDRATGCARGFGFVVFADPAVAERVVMDKHTVDGRTVEAKKAVPKDDQHILNRNIGGINGSPGHGRTRKIFVGGLPSTVTESDFKKYFDQYGTVTDVVVMYDHNTQRPRGFGFITYDSEEAVDRVLHKTFHDLNGKMVEVKRAVPKEISSGLSRSPLLGYNCSAGRANSFLNSYDRLSPISSGRSGLSPFGATGYGMGLNLEPGLSPSYGGNSNFVGSLGYARILSPYYSGNPNRYNNPIGYNAGSGRNNSLLSSNTRNVWASGGISSATSLGSSRDYMHSRSRNFGGSFGNNGATWGLNSASTQGIGNASSYNSGCSYGGGDSSFGLGGGGYGRNNSNGTGVTPTSSYPTSSTSFEGSYGNLYSSGLFYGDPTWRSSTPELEGSSTFGYGLGNIASNVTTKSSDDHIGSYAVTSRQANRGIAT